jgi:4-hydroxybenzoate polyprenyltransferase
MMMTESDTQIGIKLNPAQEKSRRNRNIAIGLILAALIVLFYAVTIVKLGPSVLNRPL